MCSSCVLNNLLWTIGVLSGASEILQQHSFEQYSFLKVRESMLRAVLAVGWLCLRLPCSLGGPGLFFRASWKMDFSFVICSSLFEKWRWTMGSLVWKNLGWFCLLCGYMGTPRDAGASHPLNWIVGQEIILTVNVRWGLDGVRSPIWASSSPSITVVSRIWCTLMSPSGVFRE